MANLDDLKNQFKDAFYEKDHQYANSARLQILAGTRTPHYEELNFALSKVDTMAAFISGKKPFTSIFAVLDMCFNVLYSRNTTAYIYSCGISADGKYAIFNTCATRPVNDDSQKLIFVDVDKKRMLFRVRMTIKEALRIANYNIDTEEKIISIHYIDGSINRYDFKGNKLSLK